MYLIGPKTWTACQTKSKGPTFVEASIGTVWTGLSTKLKRVEICCDHVEANTTSLYFKLCSNIAPTFLLFSTMLDHVEAVWSLHNMATLALRNEESLVLVPSSPANYSKMLAWSWNRLNGLRTTSYNMAQQCWANVGANVGTVWTGLKGVIRHFNQCIVW